MIAVTVHVPPHRIEEFYIRFGEFTADIPEPDAPVRTASGLIPPWVQDDDALDRAKRFWRTLSVEGSILLDKMTVDMENETLYFTPEELARKYGHPGGKSKVAGVLGGIGKAVRRAGLPIYRSTSGNGWHYIWDWDQQRYSMTPEVARVLRFARNSNS